MKTAYPSVETIQAWQRKSPLIENIIRYARLFLILPLFIIQVPLILLDALFKQTFYGRKGWSFKFRALRLLGAYAIWALNPGTRPQPDVLSPKARSTAGKLSPKNHASLVTVPHSSDNFSNDAIHQNIIPKPCPCFWQWIDGMDSPLTDLTAASTRKVMMYFVGGGMVQGHPTQVPLPWSIMQKTNIPIFGVNFRKCVTAKTAFPAALQDAVSAYFYLLNQGFMPENICVSGDSGGGGIAVTLLLYLRKCNFVMPGSCILASPFIDLYDELTSQPEALKLDILNPSMCAFVGYQYTENRPELRHTLLSPARNELPEGYTFEGFPRTLVCYGEVEMFAPMIEKFVKNLRSHGVSVEEVVGKDQIHDYPLFTKDRSDDGFFGRLMPFLNGQGKYN